jgi:hypothetical protein
MPAALVRRKRSTESGVADRPHPPGQQRRTRLDTVNMRMLVASEARLAPIALAISPPRRRPQH